MANSGGGGNTTQTNVLVNIGVQGQQAVTQATQQVQQLNSTSQAGAQINMAAPVRTLRQELRLALAEAQRLANSGQQNTAAFTAAGTRVQALRNSIEDTNRSISNLDSENRFRVFASAASLGAKAVQGYTGALAFLGVEGEDAQKTIAKLQGLMAFSSAIDAVRDLGDVWGDLLRVVGLGTTQTVAATTATAGNTTATVANNVVTNQSRLAIIGQTIATNAQAVASKAAAIATRLFGAATKAVGIGLIVSLVAALVANWDSLKESISGVLPSLKSVSGGLNTFMQVLRGVGNVVVNVLQTPIDLLIGSFKTLYKIMTLDFEGAADEIKKTSLKVVDNLSIPTNYQKGADAQLAKQRAAQRKEDLKKDVEYLNDRIEVLKAGGKDVKALQEKLYKEQLELARGNEEETKKLRQEYAVSQATDQKKKDDEAKAAAKKIADDAKAAAKKLADEAKAKLKADLDEIKKNNDDARKVTADANKSALELELSTLDLKYKKEFNLLQKRKKDVKDYNTEFKTLTLARKVEEAAVIKKYDDEIKAYDDEVNSAYLSSYEKREIEINKKADELLKKASTPKQKASVEADRAFQLNQNTAESYAAKASGSAATDLAIAENANRPNEKDTPEEATAKINNLAKAKFDAENAAFELKKVQLEGQQDEIALLTANHQKTLTDNEEANAKARKEIAEKEKEAKLATYEQVGTALGVAGQLAGEATASGKALSIASATIDTYLAAQKAYTATLVPGDPTSPFRAALAAGVAVASGLANVKRIVSVKVPGTAAGGGGGSAPIAPPVINSTVINRDNNGVNEIRDTISNQNQKQDPIRAYIVDKDLEKQKSKTAYYDSQSTI